MTALLSLSTLYSLLAGVAVGGGLGLLVVALYGWPARPADVKSPADRILAFLGVRGASALVSGLVTVFVTRWIVAGIGVALLALFWNQLFGGAGAERAAMLRVEGLAAWTESLRDTIAGAVGLEQAIPASARAAAPELREHLNAMIDRVRARMPLPLALQHFADDLDDPSADLVIAALILNAKLRGPGLREVLGALAKSAREEVDMRQRVLAQRASTRRSVQIVVVIVVVFIVGLSVLNQQFVEPYDSLIGQLVLAGVFSLFAAGFWWLRRLSVVKTPERFLAGTATARYEGVR